MVDQPSSLPGPGGVLCDDLADPERLTALAESGLGPRSDPVMEWFAERVRRWLQVPMAMVSLVRADQQVFPGAAGFAGALAEARRTPLTLSFCQYVVATARPLVIEDASDSGLPEGPAIAQQLGVVAYVGMPLTDESGHVLGSLCAIDHTARSWTSRELNALEDLAVACSTELRLRLAQVDAERERTRRDRLEVSLRESFERSQTLLEVSRSVGDSTSVEDVRAGLTDLADGVLGADHTALFVLDGDTLSLSVAPGGRAGGTAASWPTVEVDEQAPPARAVRERRIVSCSNPEECEAQFSTTARTLGLAAVVAAPVLDGPDVVGALVLGWTQPREFTPADLLLVTTIAAYTARAVGHVGWVQHRVTVAREMQQAMLTTLPEVAGLSMAARYEPADDREYVGGDWYDASPLLDREHPEDTVVAVSVGDIIGHELAAAIDMGQVRSMLRQAAWDRAAGPPSSIMHAFETANTGTGLDAAGTAIVAYLRRHDGQWTLTWVNAGHPDPILVHPDGRTELLGGHERLFGLPRGVVETRRDRAVAVPPGSILVLYTDGVVERVGVDLDERTDRLRDLLAAHAGADPNEVVDAILAGFGRGAGDDIVVLAARFT